MKSQNWARLGKNLTTCIVVVTIALFFYVYKPSSHEVAEFPSDTTTATVENIALQGLRDTVINPNEASYEDFLTVGLSPKQAKSCVAFVKKGGRFYKKEDLLKIYTITEDDYKRVQKFIHINNVSFKKKETIKKEKEPKKDVTSVKISVDINSCDTADLMRLPKIGAFRAKKIIEQRDKLGGFYSCEQLSAIYSMDSALVQELKPYIIIDTAHIKKINLNTATFKDLVKHPLISYEQTKDIMNYKRIVGTIKNAEELRKNNILTTDDYEILKFYVKTF